MRRQFDDILLGSIELFCLAAEARSFTGAANTAAVTPAAVSRSISRLEKRLGVRLFVRSTRSIRLTEGGKAYFEQCRTALDQLIEAERTVTGEQVQPSGTIRISAHTMYAHYRLLPMLPLFRARHPLIKLDVHVSNRRIDLREENFDLAIRVNPRPDSTMIVRPLEDGELVVIAAPAYLKRTGLPRKLVDLERHDCIQYSAPGSGRPVAWRFNEDGQEKRVLSVGNYCCEGDALACVTLAKAGAGLYQTFRFTVEKELAEGTLVEVLQPFGRCSFPVGLIYPHGRLLALRVRAFVDFLVEQTESLKVPKGAVRVRKPQRAFAR